MIYMERKNSDKDMKYSFTTDIAVAIKRVPRHCICPNKASSIFNLVSH